MVGGMCVDPLARVGLTDPGAPRTAGPSVGTPMAAGGRPMRAGGADCSGRRAQITTALRHDRTPPVPGILPPRVRRVGRAVVPSTPRTRDLRYERDAGASAPVLYSRAVRAGSRRRVTDSPASWGRRARAAARAGLPP
ncbi:hypothetical protein HMPREF1549_02174, partial [Actinomyces johnsonii F0510]